MLYSIALRSRFRRSQLVCFCGWGSVNGVRFSAGLAAHRCSRTRGCSGGAEADEDDDSGSDELDDSFDVDSSTLKLTFLFRIGSNVAGIRVSKGKMKGNDAG